MRALLVNDDGYKAAGLRALIAEMHKNYEILAVAPEKEQSWMGKSISGHHELHLTPVQYYEFDGYHVNGTPADCTQLGIHEIGNRPDLVVSGINHGANVGHGYIASSGTVGAAFEAAFLGIPAFAVSILRSGIVPKDVDWNAQSTAKLFQKPAAIAARIIDQIMKAGFPASTQVIAINMALDIQEDAPWVVTHPHAVPYGRIFEKQASGGYLINRTRPRYRDEDIVHSDLGAVLQGKVSIAPLVMTLSSDEGKDELAGLLGIEKHGKN